MNGGERARSPHPPVRGAGAEARGALAIFAGLLGVAFVDALPPVEGLLLAVAGGAVAVVARRGVHEAYRPVATLPAWVALGVATVFLPATPGPELLAGLAGLAVLYGTVADSGGATRSGRASALPWTILLLALATAWGGTLLLPSGTAVVGAAGALLVAAALALAVLLRAPSRAPAGAGSTS